MSNTRNPDALKGMTNEQAKKMLKAKLECLKRETSGTDFDCNNSNCDECSLCYEQGNMGEQEEALDMAIKALEQQPCEDTISRQAAIDAIMCEPTEAHYPSWYAERLEQLPSAQPESCEYYALCRRGRDENKLRARLGFCEYCNEDADGYVKPIEKNCHAFIRFGMNGWELSLKANGWHGSAKIRYCPMCGRDLLVE